MTPVKVTYAAVWTCPHCASKYVAQDPPTTMDCTTCGQVLELLLSSEASAITQEEKVTTDWV